MSTTTTIVIPRATPEMESLSEDISKLTEAESLLSEKQKKVREAKVEKTKRLRQLMIDVRAPLDIPIGVGPGRTCTVTEKETRGSVNVNYLTEFMVRKFGQQQGEEIVAEIYDSRPSETEIQIKVVDVVKLAETKKRRAEEAKLNPKPKKPRKKAAVSSTNNDDYDDDDE